MIREFSAGGVCLRRMRGRDYVAAVRVKGGTVMALPKGHVDPGETAAEAARREVREEAGVSGELVEKLGDVKYWYSRDGERVMKIVTFFLFRYLSGSVADHDHEVDSAEWVPLEDAPRLLAYRGEKQMAEAALSSVASSR
ncbi:MAG TPA: NUDIX hydrolase [Thermoleophilaceae bacterium]|nr:NUDIX hydrolase [Thermoleophilaceae bacterium]